MKYDFLVPSMWIQGTRSPFRDTDYATLAIAAVAPDGTTVATYGPITNSLGDVGSGTVNVSMRLSDIDVPDGGSMVVAFTVINKGTWSGRGTIVDALNSVGAAIVGALAGGQLVGQTNPATTTTDPATGQTTVNPPSQKALGPWWAGIVALSILAVTELVKTLWNDCDGWVVNGTMTLGRTELDLAASQNVWSWPTPYHGSDSPVGCGDNSDYFVNYQVVASVPPGPRILVDQNLSFGTVAVGDDASLTVNIESVGQADLIVSVASSPAVSSFQWKNLATTTLSPGTSTSLTVDFRPKSDGIANGTLFVNSNAPGSPRPVSLQGRGSKKINPR